MVRSHTQELLSAPRLRSACDRCHAQKLRCLKSHQGDACLRCTKFGSSCVYSTRTTRRKPKKSSTDTPTNSELVRSASARIESSFDGSNRLDATSGLDGFLDTTLFPQLMPLDILNHDLLSTGSLVDPSLNSSQQPTLVNRNTSSHNALLPSSPCDLADFNIKLADHHATLSSVFQTSPPSGFGPKVIALDQTFALTRRFIDVVEGFSLHSTDQATVLLFLSCFYRVVDIYEGLFKKMQTCAQDPNAVIPSGITLNMPVVQIGSYVPTDLWKAIEAVEAPMTAYATHYMLLLLLCTRLCEELRDAVARGIVQAQGSNTARKPDNTACVTDSFNRSVHTPELDDEPDHCNESVKSAMWERWTKLATQINLTKKAAMVFAIACL